MYEGNTFLKPNEIKLSWFHIITFQADPTPEPWKKHLDFEDHSPLAILQFKQPGALLSPYPFVVSGISHM